jgi:hypothetical protein
MEEGLHRLLPAIDISREALALVRQNYTLIAGANTLALALALPSGWMSPVVCALLSNGSALLATLNAMRPLMASRKESPLTFEDVSVRGDCDHGSLQIPRPQQPATACGFV